MIRRLRTRHRWMFAILALIVPALLILVFSLRRPLPTPENESADNPVPQATAPVIGD